MALTGGEATTGALQDSAAPAAGACVVVAGTALACALAATMAADVPLRDPGGVSTSRLLVACAVVVLFIAVDVAVRARARTGRWLSRAAVAAVARERWSRGRVGAVVLALVTYSITYFAYRNIKSVAPLLRPGDVFDRALLDIDRALLVGSDPASVLHAVLGMDAANALAVVYMAFFIFIPIALAAALVFPQDIRTSLFVANALAVTWLLGAVSYVLLPAIGPFHADPGTYAALPDTSVSDMQTRLMTDRAAFLADPSAPGAAQSIGAFASLHTAFCCTVALAAQRLRAPRAVVAGAWGMTALTVLATIYFGWHYVVDDVAGVGIAVLALMLAGVLTGVTPRARGRTSLADRSRRGVGMTLRLLVAPPIVAAVTVVAALVATAQAGVRFHDPDHVAAQYVLMVGAGVALLITLDIALRAARRTGTRRPSREAMRAVRRQRWTRRRLVAVIVGLGSFYVTYLAYRNLKGVVPLLRPGELVDRQLFEVDRGLFLGSDPATLLQDVLGTGVAAHVLSTIYAAFIVFLPLSLGVALVFARDVRVSLFYATTLSINWILGAATYLLVPALGPVYAFPGLFSELPRTTVTHLQEMLLDQRIGFLADPATGTAQAVAAFASLHIAMSFSAVLAAHALRLNRWVIWGLWAWLVLTIMATIYLGWHYVVDDLAGLAIGALAFTLARALTGYDLRPAVQPAVDRGGGRVESWAAT